MGAAVANALVAQGCHVTVLDRQTRPPGDGIRQVVCDVTSESDVGAALAAAKAQHGPARIIVNCAGVGDSARVLGRDGPHSMEKFRRMLDINVCGSFNVIRLAMADLAEASEIPGFGRGVIVNTASIAAFDGQIGQVAYAASKAAIVGMTLPLARELARISVRVMTICPGVFSTPMVDAKLSEKVLDSLLTNVAYPKRAGQPSEFAQLVLAIVQNPMLNGETIRLDGGLRMSTL